MSGVSLRFGLLAAAAGDLALAVLLCVRHTPSHPRHKNRGRPATGRTELTGMYEFSLEFTPEAPPGPNALGDPSGSNFLEALRDELGLKLQSDRGAVDVFLLDHLEQPTAN
jgi:uncharacterized protein (TIGR03435 family)